MAHVAFLYRTHHQTYTKGVLLICGRLFATIEPPWLSNQRNVSCIPPGDYLVDYLPKSGSGKYDRTYHVKSVPGRTGILIHAGNTVDHTKGCILIGKKHGALAGKMAALQSQIALSQLRQLIGKESFTLKVIDNERAS